MHKKNILFIYPQLSSFIKLDKAILQQAQYNVIENTYNWKDKKRVPYFLLHQLFFLLFNLSKINIILISFGGYWSLLPTIFGKIFKKKVYIIIHGSDAIVIKKINYGDFLNPTLSIILKMSYKNATMLLPVSKSLIHSKNTSFSAESNYKGLLEIMPSLKTPIKVIYNGIDVNFWHALNIQRNPKKVLTVLNHKYFYLKGGDLIIKLAKHFPDYEFYIAGCNNIPNEYDIHDLKNIYLLGHVSAKTLLKEYSSSTYYLQLSLTEGFGYSLCEAMSCGCIPIVSNVNIMPEIIGNSGFVLKKRNVKELTDLFSNAINISPIQKEYLSKIARERIVKNYSLQKRKQHLLNTLMQKIN